MSVSRTETGSTKQRMQRDLVVLGIAIAAILMFIGTGSSVLPQIARSILFGQAAPDNMLSSALLLNIALIIFGMRRYRELVTEIEERRKAELKAQRLAETDELTGCLNRRSITPVADGLIERARPGRDAVAFLMVDLDNFKQVNDLNGHKVGDRLLLRAADRMRSVLPAGGQLARLGGDEFACVVPFAARTPHIIDQLAAQLVEVVAEPETIDGIPIEITMSVGVASTLPDPALSESNPSGELLMHRADIAMYHAKKQGKNRHFWFEPAMESELRFRNELEQGIRRGIQNGEFVPFYEQQVDLESGKLVGFEMLARWKSPELGLVFPDIFIPVAEDIGAIGAMSEALIDQALVDAKAWNPSLSLSVNISPIQLRDPWFSQKLLKLLVKHNFPAHRLNVEITESCLHENIGVVRTMITSLKNQGVKISLDDFGTGYSSLSQLQTLPFDCIKIDRSFISELTQENANVKIVNAIISLGEGLELPITAEGIADGKILEILKAKGKMLGQGYHYGQPEDAGAVARRLAEHGLLAAKEAAAEEEQQELIQPDIAQQERQHRA